jgi:hypothetical protein
MMGGMNDITQQDYYAAQGRAQAGNASDEDLALVEQYEAERAPAVEALPLADEPAGEEQAP